MIIDEVVKWCELNDLSINRSKSAILQIRVDKRTPRARNPYARGIPFLANAKYLGFTIDDDLSFRTEVNNIKC